MAELGTDVRFIKGVGEARAKKLLKLGIKTLYDLIATFPRDYEDRREVKSINDLRDGDIACFRAYPAAQPRLSHVRAGLDLTKLRVVDDTGSIDVTFFNQSFVKDAIKPGVEYVFYGRVAGITGLLELSNPEFEPESAPPSKTRRIVPIYALTAGISRAMLANAVRQGLDACGDILPDVLPRGVREKYNLASAKYSYETVHFPPDFEQLEIARRRLIFEEIFVLSAAMRLIRAGGDRPHGAVIEPRGLDEFCASLPYTLTVAQRRAIDEAAADMASGVPMRRLVQGDVGSGKTVVAAALCMAAAKCGYVSAFMAPTEILAQQHYNTLTAMLSPHGVRVELLTGGMTAKSRRESLARIESGEADVIIGTHALISDGVEIPNLALVITDEQHRFGVSQRSALASKGSAPHVLVMSATPIPRTLAMIIYGDMDVSVIDELPPGRRAIETFSVDERYRARINKFMLKLVNEGRQVFVVCPAIEESENVEPKLKSAVEVHEQLQSDVFPDLSVGLLHGGMKTRDKDDVMARFVSGEIQILVATTVVEVGVDVPNAALMVVENADRFGLSQLHQLRGRVGRGEHASYCVLFEGAGGGKSRERLQAMCDTNDGFKIAEEDLRLRGPGDFFGSRQHGLPQFKIADFATDMELLTLAMQAAVNVLAGDPGLDLPDNRRLKTRVMEQLAADS